MTVGAERVRVHTPSGVMLPSDFKLQRTYPQTPAHKFDNDGSVIVEHEVPDTHTLLYDVFRSPDRRKVLAIGPDPRNLSDELGRLRVAVAGRPLRHKSRVEGVFGRRTPKTRLLFLEIALPPDLAARDELEVEFQWRNFTATASASPPPPPAAQPLMTLTTIQKNYPLEWIRDWAHYYHRVHQVERIVLYDNGSDDFDALREGLTELDEGLRVELVRWPYPFGLFLFRYCQQAALNHCYQRFGVDTSHFLNFDLDEYLVNLTGASLPEHLERRLRGRVTTLLTTQYVVPDLPTAPPASGPPRAHHFKHRNRKPRWHGLNTSKTIFTPRNLTFIGNHDNNPRMPRWLARLADTREWWSNRFADERLAWLPIHRRQRASVSELYFNHYKGLNTGWKRGESRLEHPDPELHEPDPEMPALLARAGLAEEGGE